MNKEEFQRLSAKKSCGKEKGRLNLALKFIDTCQFNVQDFPNLGRFKH